MDDRRIREILDPQGVRSSLSVEGLLASVGMELQRVHDRYEGLRAEVAFLKEEISNLENRLRDSRG